jgi:hypothetical protein
MGYMMDVDDMEIGHDTLVRNSRYDGGKVYDDFLRQYGHFHEGKTDYIRWMVGLGPEDLHEWIWCLA